MGQDADRHNEGMPMLAGDNYDVWSMSMRPILRNREEWVSVAGLQKPPKIPPPELKDDLPNAVTSRQWYAQSAEYYKKNTSACRTIRSALSEQIATETASINDCQELWAVLERRFASATALSRSSAVRKICDAARSNCDVGQNVNEWAATLEDAVREWPSLELTIEEVVVMLVITKLSSRFPTWTEHAESAMSDDLRVAKPIRFAEFATSLRSHVVRAEIQKDFIAPVSSMTALPKLSSLSGKERFGETSSAIGRPHTVNVSEPPSGTEEDENDQVKDYPHQHQLILIMFGLCLSVFCSGLDDTIVATAVPRITDEFHSVNDIGWYGSAYLLTRSTLQLFYGKIYSLWTIKWIFLGAFAIFELGSVICGAAPNSVSFIVGRAIAGMGGAGVFSGAVLIIAGITPLDKRATYIGAVAATYGLSAIVGPVLGGALTDKVSWRWCFYINLPIGAATCVLVLFLYKTPRHTVKTRLRMKEKLKRLDFLGSACFVPSIVCLLLAMQWGGTTYSWHSWRVVLLLVLFAVLLICFAVVQYWKGEHATVPLHFITRRSMATGCFLTFCNGATFFVVAYWLPIWFQAIQGVSPITSGLHQLPTLVSLFVFLIGSSISVTKFGYYVPFSLASSIIMPIGAGLLTTLAPGIGMGRWIGYQIVFGLGAGLGFQMPFVASQASMSAEDVPIATGLLAFAQALGGALSLSIGQNIFINHIVSAIARLGMKIDPKVLIAGGVTNLISIVPAPALPAFKVILSNSITQVLYIAVVVASLTIIGSIHMEWLNLKKEKSGIRNIIQEKTEQGIL